MSLRHGHRAHAFTHRLRKSSTREEEIPWERLRGAKFKRRAPIDRYVVDFFCHAAGLVVEIDGRRHAVFDDYDEARSRVLEAAGAHVLRFTNDEVCNDLESVLQRIVPELRLPF